MISIVNYGMGNIGSVINMFKRVGVLTEVISTVSEIEKAEKILLPGVGSFDAAMTKIQELGIREALDHKALNDKIPILGICLGMQLLTRGSEEGSLKGFGWVDAQTKSFKKAIDTKKYKVPHMGWNRVSIAKTNPLTHGLEDSSETRFYFVHSYYIECLQTEDSLLKTTYGVEFDSGLNRGNIYGVQFHPEKSHKFGMKLFKNFASLI